MKELPALTRLTDLDEVAASFVFTQEGKIIGSALPPNYTETMLMQVILVLKQVIKTVDKTKSPLRELRFAFENYTIWLKLFGSDKKILAVLLQSTASPAILRQPVNLAIVNLEKALNTLEDNLPLTDASRSLANAAHLAELAMLKLEGEDSNGSFESMVLLSESFFGTIAGEVLEHGLRSKQLGLPINDGAQMRSLMNYCADLIMQSEIKKIYLETMDDLIERLELKNSLTKITPDPKKK